MDVIWPPDIFLQIIAIAVPTIAICLIYRQNYHIRRVESARLLVDYVEKILDKHQKLLDALRDRSMGNQKELNERDVKVLFNDLESIMKFVHDGVLDKGQVLSTLRTTLMRIKKDKPVMDMATEFKEKSDNKKLYELILDFIEKEID